MLYHISEAWDDHTQPPLERGRVGLLKFPTGRGRVCLVRPSLAGRLNGTDEIEGTPSGPASDDGSCNHDEHPPSTNDSF